MSAQAALDSVPTPVVHITDLHRPHNNPDDHWDLACVYAPARRGDAVFSFDPIRFTGRGGGDWTADPNGASRFIFHVRDTNRYGPAATGAMKSPLATLP